MNRELPHRRRGGRRTRCARSTPTSCRCTRSRRRRRSSRASRSSSRTAARTRELVDVESEHSAMSAAIGSALAGARTITATSSQGLALMAEVVYIAASMRAPIVMAVGNRALSGPINIHCDHSDSMLIRDSGVVQLFAENAQEAYDLMVDRAAASPSTPTSCCRCSSARTASRSRTRPSRSSCFPTRTCAHFVGDYRPPASAARRAASRRRRGRSRCPTTTSSCAGSRRQRSTRRRSRSPTPATEFALLTGRRLTRARGVPARRRRPRRSSRSARPPAPSRTSSTSFATKASAVGLLRICSFRPFPATAVARRAARRSRP